METVDEHLVRRLSAWSRDADEVEGMADPAAADVEPASLVALFEAQVQSRHLDLAARWLQARGEGFYTIGSAGHESNAAVAMALRPTDPALLHYRSGGFYAARAQQVAGTTPILDVLRSLATSTDDPISGGRHKVFGNRELSIIPQTSTIGSHLPRAFGLGFSLGRAAAAGVVTPWPDDAIVVTSFGDASANHSTTVGALNAAAYCTYQGVAVPVLFVCEDNGIGISTRTPAGWAARSLSGLPGIDYVSADGTCPAEAMLRATAAAESVRTTRRPTVLHLRTVRFMGHAGSDAELAYRSRADIVRDYELDPLLATAATLVHSGTSTAAELLESYEDMRGRVMSEAASMVGTRRLASADDVMAPLTATRPARVREAAGRSAVDRQAVFNGRLPEEEGPINLSATINATLTDVMAAWPTATVFGEDVAVKGGVYGVTRGLRKKFGAPRVFDTLLDEQTILGTALGSALAGFLPIPEIQYLAYLHNAEDQLRGEAASLAFFSGSQYANGMVVRVAGLAYQKGFGGHFHNDNSVAVLRDIPGLVLAVPSHPAEVPGLLRTCVALAAEEGRVCVFLEPIALYHQKDLLDGDGEWLASYRPPQQHDSDVFGQVSVHGSGTDLLIVTFGNGVRMSLRAAARLREEGIGIGCTVLDLRWLAPLPEADLVAVASRFERVLVVDETRRSGGVGEAVIAVLTDHSHGGEVRRVSSKDSFIPLGPASAHVLLSDDDIVDAATSLAGVAPS
ncbi:thiamine pyrophosphate-dependent enzyme [Aeromicrobium sp.]|uniref:thiamine pyrophosphate-dependent enzyme n=1 Tax=Aeromicrobium sp. TaxID=1871063 RepID=UPI0019A5A36D|nr:thiamine pyrophosphate-dependent enzyme [Aeromicrobium sp.]MBC7629922.1 MFS transporter [Aeromicrobium sp.]